MSDTFHKKLADEIAVLEAELAATPAFRRLQKARSLLAEYMVPDTPENTAFAEPNKAAPERINVGSYGEQRPQRRQRNEATQAILDAVAEILRGTDTPMRTANILTILREQGHEIPGEKALNNLSAMLSYSKMFQAHGRSGWTLVDADRNTEAADDPNLGGRASTASDEHRPTSGGTTSAPVEPVQGGGT